MQNRFKFRVWHKPLKQMHYNDFVITATGYTAKIYEENVYMMKFNQQDLEFDKQCVVMQCTGLKDKNGKLIYEGDIVKLFNDDLQNIHVVKFGDFAMYDFDFQEDFEKGSTAVYGWYLGGLKLPVPLSISIETSGLNLEVIGNIYENPLPCPPHAKPDKGEGEQLNKINMPELLKEIEND